MKLLIASDIHGSAYWCSKLMDAYQNEKADRMVDGKDFYFTLTSDNASIGTANYAHITLYNANVEKTAERIAAMDLTGYTAESVKVLNDAMSEMKALGTTATKDQVKAAVKKVLDAKNALRAADENNPAYEAVTGVSLDKTTAKLTEKGQTVELKATVAPATASIKDVSFATSDANVATVDANGKVTAVGNGTATITVTTDDGNKTAICSVTVELPAEPTPDPVPADLVQKVNNEIAAAADKKEADYTADSWKNYQKALEAATKAAKDEKATKTDLEKALADLNIFCRQRIKNYNEEKHVITEQTVVKFYNAALSNEDHFMKKYNAYGSASWSDVKKALILCILDFRRNEFMWEGLRWWDMMRYRIPITHTTKEGDSNTLYPGDDRWLLQLPETAELADVQLNPRSNFLSRQW